MVLLNKKSELGRPKQYKANWQLHLTLSYLLTSKNLITFLLSAAGDGWRLFKSSHLPCGLVLPHQEAMRALLGMSQLRMLKNEVDYDSSANEH